MIECLEDVLIEIHKQRLPFIVAIENHRVDYIIRQLLKMGYRLERVEYPFEKYTESYRVMKGSKHEN